jgi:hypothetical protein
MTLAISNALTIKNKNDIKHAIVELKTTSSPENVMKRYNLSYSDIKNVSL